MLRSLDRFVRRPYFFTGLTVPLLWAAFFEAWLAPMVFVGLVPLFICFETVSSRKAALSGLLWGMAVYLGVLFWISDVTFAGWLGLAFYHGLFAGIAGFCWRFMGPGWMGAIRKICLWAVLEWLREHVGPGFSFGSLYQVLAPFPVCIQIASLGGGTLVTAWIVAVNLSLVKIFPVRKPSGALRWVPTLLLLLAPLLFGALRLSFGAGVSAAAGDSFAVGAIQPNFPPELKWDPARVDDQFRCLMELSHRFEKGDLEMLVWPESALLQDPRHRPVVRQKLIGLSRDLDTILLIGSTDELSLPGEIYNSVFMVRPNGTINPIYRKMNLVPFGESIPFETWLPGVRHLTPIRQSFTAGSDFPRLLVGEKPFVIWPLICFEDTLPGFVRRVVDRENGLLLTLTNDGWFRGRSGPRAHELLARVRAVENGVPMVRAANTGVSSWITPYGIQQAAVKDEHGRQANIPGTLRATLQDGLANPTLFGMVGALWLPLLAGLGCLPGGFRVRIRNGLPD